MEYNKLTSDEINRIACRITRKIVSKMKAETRKEKLLKLKNESKTGKKEEN